MNEIPADSERPAEAAQVAAQAMIEAHTGEIDARIKNVAAQVTDAVDGIRKEIEAHKPVEPELDEHAKAELQDELRQALGRGLARQAIKYERRMLPLLKRYFWDQRSAVLKNFDGVAAALRSGETGFTAIEITEKLLGDIDWNKELTDTLNPVVSDAVLEGADQIKTQAKSLVMRQDVASDVLDDSIVGSFLKEQNALMGRVNATTAEALTASAENLLAGIQAGESLDTLMDVMKVDLKDTFNNTEVRRRTIARTESMRGMNGGRNEQMKASGAAEKEWLTVRDGNVRHSHELLDGVRIALGDKWITANGNYLEYPLDPAGGAGDTINCRCVSIAVF